MLLLLLFAEASTPGPRELDPSRLSSRSPGSNNDPDSGQQPDLSKGPRVTYSLVSIFCMLLLATMLGRQSFPTYNFAAMSTERFMTLGSRIHTFTDRSHGQHIALIRILVFTLYFASIAFVATAAILQSGLDLSTIGSCRAAIYVCLVFYVGSKVLVQLFLVERAHAVRCRLKRRRHDWIWLVSVAIIVLGFGSIAGLAFAEPIADLAVSDKKCRIGVPAKVTVPLIVYDILINVALTGVFVALLKPLLAFGRLRQYPQLRPTTHQTDCRSEAGAAHKGIHIAANEPDIEQTCSNAHAAHASIESSDRTLRILVYKSLVGAVAMLIPTIVNLGLLFRWRGEEQGWLCFTLCTLDGE